MRLKPSRKKSKEAKEKMMKIFTLEVENSENYETAYAFYIKKGVFKKESSRIFWDLTNLKRK